MQSSGEAESLRVPEGTRLLHIGPHKTGTTAIQAALWHARPALLGQGVRHAGPTRNPSNQVRAVVGQRSAFSDDPPPIGQWRALVREIERATEPRVIASSEFFAAAHDDAIRRIVEDLDPARVRIVVTLRPLTRIIPSMWQQNVQAGRTLAFEAWLDGLFPDPPRTPNRPFWRLHRHDVLIRRWAEVVGADRVVAVVADERDPPFLLRAFEDLLGLRRSTLLLDSTLTNRSLTRPEAEAIRAFNVAFEAEGLPRELHARIMRFGAAQEMKRRPPGRREPRIRPPGSAAESIHAAQVAIVEGIRASRVRVVGNLEALAEDDASSQPELDPETDVPPDVAAAMGMGILIASGAAREPGMRLGRVRFAEPIELARLSTLQVAAVLAGRLRNGLRHGLGGPLRRRGTR